MIRLALALGFIAVFGVIAGIVIYSSKRSQDRKDREMELRNKNKDENSNQVK